jgi:hypothetical protein
VACAEAEGLRASWQIDSGTIVPLGQTGGDADAGNIAHQLVVHFVVLL